jgi:hypothetical protein
MMTAIQKVLKFCDDALIGFRRDPADSEYQRGYEAALEEMLSVATKAQEDEDDRAIARGET